MAIEAATNLAGLDGATSVEFEENPAHPIVICGPGCGRGEDGGAERGEKDMRLGAFPTQLKEGSLAASVYGEENVSERHRHRYEINPEYEGALEDAGLMFSGWSPDGEMVEMVEISPEDHPYYIGTLAHPEFQSRPTAPHPLFASFVEAAIEYKQERKARRAREIDRKSVV